VSNDLLAKPIPIAIVCVSNLSALASLVSTIVRIISPFPATSTAEALAERVDLPLLWTAQKKAVGLV
jgi:hypothetical protein